LNAALQSRNALLAHAAFATTLIYADYSPDERRERDLVARAFTTMDTDVSALGSNLGSKLSETESNSDAGSSPVAHPSRKVDPHKTAAGGN
jgi:hypothetical protein